MTRYAHRVAPLLALVLVNAFAVTGQAQWAYRSLGHNWLVAAGFAATLESVALFLTAEASRAMLNNDRSGTLRLGAYLVGVLVGAMNYSAHAPDWRPTAMAIAFGLLSTLSPILWTIHTRGQHRAELRAAGLVDPRAVKLPLALVLMYPGKAFRMFRLAVWAGENRPALVRAMFAERAALRQLDQVDAVRYAHAALGTSDPHAARVWLQARGVLVTSAALDQATPARSVAARAALPVPVSPAPAGQVARVDQVDTHAAELAAAASKRDAARIAYAHLGPVSAGAVVRHLAEHGIRVQRSEAAAVARSLDLAAEPTGEHPLVSVSLPSLAARTNGHHPAELAAIGGN